MKDPDRRTVSLAVPSDPPPVSDRIGFVFHLDSDRLVLEVRGSLPSDVPLEDRRLGRAILEATVDRCEDLGDAIRLEKRLESLEP
jgi:hypothetical protein